MPTVHPPARVLVTGASGFIGSWICKVLLEAGYAVRGCVRSAPKAEYLKKLFAEFGDKFECVVVVDPSGVDGCRDGIEGVDAVVHTAAPVTFTTEEQSEWKKAIYDSTKNLLDTIRTHSTTVKRFVYISSAQAMLGKPLTHIYHEDDWNDGAVEAVTKDPVGTSGQVKYQAGKVLAERAVLGYPSEHEGLGWDVVSFVPAWTFGPVISQFSSLEDLSFSPRLFYQHMTEPRPKDKVMDYGSDYIDVRDVADAVSASLKSKKAAGERFILDAGAYTFQNLYDAVRGEPGVQAGDPDAPPFAFPGPFADPTKAKTLLELQFRDLRTTAKDALQSLRERGI
ncbi:NAD(P)-binding protein [Phanerochaete sordida]|uniref:NAD(P)-binding protein n=1 Tax=Phanerochaete sordida TaxID=48140 RepID=A0A9P3GAR9_9APHY|nr:NAD(P)-binding protein [Phanerochaete sordida]